MPINFARIDDLIYFHGSKKGRKIDILSHNSFASFSAVKAYSLIDSDFSSRDGFDMILENLESRSDLIDRETIAMMKAQKVEDRV